ncbi:D-alanyl-D-alanine carboxypeptidase family protein [Myxococcaceae bacterium GXIMD 01537]
MHTRYSQPRYGQVPLAEGHHELTNPSNASLIPLERHGGPGPHLILRWNEMPTLPSVIDVVVHLHGFASPRRAREDRIELRDMPLGRHKEAWSGLDFHDPDAAQGTTPAVGRTTPTLAILPRGRFTGSGSEHNGYDFPALAGHTEGLQNLINFSFNWFLDNILQPGGASVSMGRLILTAHSGGGIELSRILAMRDGSDTYRYNPDEVHVFDGLYGEGVERPYLRWATRRIADERAGRASPGALRVQWTPGSTAIHSEALQAGLQRELARASDNLGPRYRAELSSLDHGVLPRRYGWRLLRDASEELPGISHPRHQAVSHAAQDRHPPSYRESLEQLEQTRLEGRMAVEQWERQLTEWEGVLSRNLIPRVPVMKRQELAEQRWPYELIGRLNTHDEHVRRLDAVLTSIRTWILDTTKSAIAQVTAPPGARHFLNEVTWRNVGFPGNDEGPSAEATSLFASMARLCPERRVPQLIRQLDIDAFVEAVNGQRGKKLFPDARRAFEAMHATAAQDTVTLTIASAWRSSGSQSNLGANNTNRRAVGGQRSAHRYGLAIDLLLSVRGLSLTEANTHSMPNMVNMYRSPVYKWMYVNGESQGFFPYAHEPWHWEYNPVGFPEQFPVIVADLRRRAA